MATQANQTYQYSITTQARQTPKHYIADKSNHKFKLIIPSDLTAECPSALNTR